MNGPVNSEDRKIAAIIKQQLRQLRRQGRLLGRALAYRNFRLFFCGQGLSLLGTWVQSIAMSCESENNCTAFALSRSVSWAE